MGTVIGVISPHYWPLLITVVWANLVPTLAVLHLKLSTLQPPSLLSVGSLPFLTLKAVRSVSMQQANMRISNGIPEWMAGMRSLRSLPQKWL